MDNTSLIQSLQMRMVGDSGIFMESSCLASLLVGGLKLSQEPFSTKAHNHGNFMPHPLHPSLTTLNGFLRTQHTIPGRAIGTWSIHKCRNECTMPISFMVAQRQQAHSKGIPFVLSIRVIPCQAVSNYLPYSIPTLSI